jgi:acetyl esterase/lipase
MKEFLDLHYTNDNDNSRVLDIFLPDNDNFTTVLWFHGGGIVSGSKQGGDVPKGLLNEGIAVVAPDYRMYPTAKFPEFIEDAANAVAFTVKKMKELGGNGKLFIGGSSAGAYLTMMLCFNKEYLKAVGVNEETDLSGFISDSAQVFTHFNVLKEMGLNPNIQYIDEKAPIYYVNPSLTLRPLFIDYYSNDMICRPEENRLFYASLKRFLPDADVTIKELEGTHCSAIIPDKEGKRRLEPFILEFINKH